MNDLARRGAILLALFVVPVLAACSTTGGARHTVQLDPQNNSGVVGSVTLVELGPRATRVEVAVEPAGNPDMPAHIHPGSCADLVPQPKYPLQNVINGFSTTDVPAGVSELMAGDLAVNLHRSNDDLATYTACADLR